MADGNAVVGEAENGNATCLHAEDEVRDGMVRSPACGTGARQHGHQISADPVQALEISSVDKRWADAPARRCLDGAGVFFNGRKVAPVGEKTTTSVGSSPSCSSSHLAARTTKLAVSCGRAFSSSLVSSKSEGPDGHDGHPPDSVDLFGAVSGRSCVTCSFDVVSNLRRRKKRKKIPRGRCERPHGGARVDRKDYLEARVHGRVVINVQHIPSKEGTITNVSDWKADAAARRCSDGAGCSLQKRETLYLGSSPSSIVRSSPVMGSLMIWSQRNVPQ